MVIYNKRPAFFKLDYFTITDFGDDGSVADGGTKSVIIIIFYIAR